MTRPGRKPIDPSGPLTTLAFGCPDDLRRAIDRLRGREPVAAWLRRVVRERVERDEVHESRPECIHCGRTVEPWQGACPCRERA